MSKHHLVLLPGLDGTGQLFTPLCNVLPPEFTATIARYPPDETLTYDQLQSHVQQAIPAQEPYVLVAESFSGPLAVAWAATQPDRLQALVLCASFVSNPAPRWLHWMQGLNHPFWFQFRLPHSFVRYAAALWDCDASVIDGLIEHTKTVCPTVLAHRFAQVMQVDVRAQLLHCRVPLLYLRGTRDLLVMRGNWEEIARLKPAASCAEIDASHFVLQHKPQEAMAAIQAFLAANFDR
ncbi:MAG TPA: alpha/beta hydrolase [Blastocatellia bacterium]|nr:alpha/beta hydrolase [Blastocatellia bacterium]